MNPSESISLRESISLFVRGLSFWRRACPQMLWSTLLDQIFNSLAPYVTIWFSAQILGELTGGRDPQRLTRLVILTLVISCLTALVGAILHRWHTLLNITSDWSYEYRLIEKLVNMGFSILDRQEVYDLLSSINQSTNWNGWGLVRLIWILNNLAKAVATIAGGLALTWGLLTTSAPLRGDWLDALNHPLIPLGLIGLLVGIYLLSGRLDALSVKSAELLNVQATLGNRIHNYFAGIVPTDRKRHMDIRLYEQPSVCQHYDDSSPFLWNGVMGRWLRGSRAWGLTACNALNHSTALPIYAYTCLKAWAGAFGIGPATQYIAAITNLSGGLSFLTSSLGEIRANAPFLKKTFSFLDIPNEMYQGSLTTEKRSDRQYEVEFRDVSFRYPDTEAWALRHVNLKFQIGRRLAVVGENGSGKTTFIKLLCRLYDPTEGEILLNGIDIRKYDYRDYLRLFSVVFQDFQLLPLTLGENVAAAQSYDPALAEDCLKKAGFAGRLAQMPKGLDTSLYRTFDPEGVEISGGEAQKIALARALYRDAPFIILDEPTAALDPLAEAEVYSKFDQIAGDKTAVYISHRLSSCRFCDDIAVFRQGEVVQKGTHDSLLADAAGTYAALWNAQAQYYTKKAGDSPEADPA